MKRFKNFHVGDPDDQIHIEAYPKKGKHERSDIDVLRLTLKSRDGDEPFEIDMTPEEALEIGNALNNAAMFWLMKYKPYYDTFMKRKRDLDRKDKRFLPK